MRTKWPSPDIIASSDVGAMLTTESADLKEFILALLGDIFSAPPLLGFEQKLFESGCLVIAEQLIYSRRNDRRPPLIFERLLLFADGQYPYDAQLPGYIVDSVESSDPNIQRTAFQIVNKLADTSEPFARDICQFDIAKVFSKLAADPNALSKVARAIFTISRWESCRPALVDEYLLPPDQLNRLEEIGIASIEGHLRKFFSESNDDIRGGMPDAIEMDDSDYFDGEDDGMDEEED
jgi:hypothetical protein